MAIVNFAQREIQVRIVWFGPPEANLDVCLDRLHRALVEVESSRLLHFGAEGLLWRSGYFDYALAPDTLSGFTTRVGVYTLPSALDHPVHRKEVISGADGVVYVADAQPQFANQSMEGMFALERVLVEEGLRLAALPASIYVLNGDAPGARSQAQVSYDLNPYDFPVFMATGPEDEALLQAHEIVLDAGMERIRQSLAGKGSAQLTAVHRSRSLTAEDVVGRHVQAITDSSVSLDTVDQDDATPVGPVDAVVELGCLPSDLMAYTPLRILGSAVNMGRAQIDLLLQPDEATLPRRLRVVLVARQAMLDHSATVPPPITASLPLLPDDLELEPEPPQVIEIHPLVYGLVGTVAGVLAGGLLGFLIFG